MGDSSPIGSMIETLFNDHVSDYVGAWCGGERGQPLAQKKENMHSYAQYIIDTMRALTPDKW